MKLNLDTLDVQTFETAAADSDVSAITAEPKTNEPAYHSKCYVCYETDRTMCKDTCEVGCPIYPEYYA